MYTGSRGNLILKQSKWRKKVEGLGSTIAMNRVQNYTLLINYKLLINYIITHLSSTFLFITVYLGFIVSLFLVT